MAVLAESVQTEHILFLEGLERLGLYLLSIELLRLEFFASILRSLLLVLLHLLMLSSQLVLLLLLLHHGLIVFDGFFESIIEETAVVDKGHGHIATKTRDLLEVHSFFTHHFFDKAMFERVDDILFLLLLLFLLTSCSRYSLVILLIEDLMRDRCLFCSEHAVDHEFVTFARMHELNHFGSVLVLVSRVIGIVLDLSCRIDELADVDALSFGLPLDKVDQLLEVVLEVMARLQLFDEGFTFTLHVSGR